MVKFGVNVPNIGLSISIKVMNNGFQLELELEYKMCLSVYLHQLYV